MSNITYRIYLASILVIIISLILSEVLYYSYYHYFLIYFRYLLYALLFVFTWFYITINGIKVFGFISRKSVENNDALLLQLTSYKNVNAPFRIIQKLVEEYTLQKKELLEATLFVNNIEKGNLEVSTNNLLELSNRKGGLFNALISMRDQMITIAKQEKERNWSSEGLARFVEILRANSSNEAGRYDVLVFKLVKYLGANQGGLYLVNQENGIDKEIELVSFYAYERKKYLSHKLDLKEGLLGQAYLERDIIFMTDIPENYIKITSGTGEATPRSIIIVPLLLNDVVYGMIELASFNSFEEYQIEFLKRLCESIASTVLNNQVNLRTQLLLEESRQQTSQMLKQEEEMRQNLEELHATQEEMRRSEGVHLQEIKRLQVLYEENLTTANQKNEALTKAEEETKELVAEIQASQESITRNYQILFEKFGQFNIESKFDQLTAIRSTKKRNIEDYFDIIRHQIYNYAGDKMIIDAMNAFKSAFQDLTFEAQQILDFDKIRKHVKEYYELEFLPRLNANSDNTEKLDKYWVDDLRTIYMQYLYISANANETGKKHLLDKAEDKSEYSKLHALYHPIIRNFLLSFGYYDIFLVDSDTGHIVYSVFKEVDYTTSLLTGPYKDTNFARAFREAKNSTQRNFMKLFDFEPYDPSYTAPASFISTPIYDGEKKIGVLIFQMPIDKINSIMTGDKKWNEDGLGQSGETYLVGDDYKMRSTSRFLIQDPVGYFNELQRIGYNETIIKKIKRLNTTILLQDVKTEAVINALRGNCSKNIVLDYRNISVLSAYDKLSIQDVNWVICSDIDEAEVLDSIAYLKEMSIE